MSRFDQLVEPTSHHYFPCCRCSRTVLFFIVAKEKRVFQSIDIICESCKAKTSVLVRSEDGELAFFTGDRKLAVRDEIEDLKLTIINEIKRIILQRKEVLYSVSNGEIPLHVFMGKTEFEVISAVSSCIERRLNEKL